MESATLTRPRALPAASSVPWPWVALGLLLVASVVGFLLYPTYPNYDSYYSLLWGREVLDLQAPTFEGFRVPTEHPLAIVAGAALSLLGDIGDRVWIALIIASYLWLVAGVYRLTATYPDVRKYRLAAGRLFTNSDYILSLQNTIVFTFWSLGIKFVETPEAAPAGA